MIFSFFFFIVFIPDVKETSRTFFDLVRKLRKLHTIPFKSTQSLKNTDIFGYNLDGPTNLMPVTLLNWEFTACTELSTDLLLKPDVTLIQL